MLGFWLVLAAKRRGFDAARRQRVMGVVRVGVYAMCVALGLGAWSYRSARAEVGKASISVGRDLAKVADLLQEPKRVRLNGEEVNAATAVVSEDVGKILDRFEAHCRQDPGALGDAWRMVAQMDTEKDELKNAGVLDPLKPGVLRHEARGEGVVLCMTRGTKTPGTIGEAIAAFERSHDLGALGKLRYVFAQPSGDKTLVLTVWTEDSFRLDALFPASGDAPGADPEDIGRPPESTRLLGMSMEGTPFGAYVYRTTVSAGAAMKHYDARMDDKGYVVIDPPGRAPDDGGGREAGHAYVKDGVMFTVAAGRADDGSTIVSIGQMSADAPTFASR